MIGKLDLDVLRFLASAPSPEMGGFGLVLIDLLDDLKERGYVRGFYELTDKGRDVLQEYTHV